VSDLHKWLSNDRIPYTASIIEPKLISMTFMANDEERIKAWFVENRIRIRTTPLGPQATRALERPDDFISLSEERKWEIDRELGILDWDGSEDT
jgi:hypothetical protein